MAVFKMLSWIVRLFEYCVGLFRIKFKFKIKLNIFLSIKYYLWQNLHVKQMAWNVLPMVILASAWDKRFKTKKAKNFVWEKKILLKKMYRLHKEKMECALGNKEIWLLTGPNFWHRDLPHLFVSDSWYCQFQTNRLIIFFEFINYFIILSACAKKCFSPLRLGQNL